MSVFNANAEPKSWARLSAMAMSIRCLNEISPPLSNRPQRGQRDAGTFGKIRLTHVSVKPERPRPRSEFEP